MNKQEAIDALECYRRNTAHILGENDAQVKTIETCIMLVREAEDVYKALENVPSAQSENLQPTCNQLATDIISRQAAIDALGEGAMTNYQNAGHNNGLVKAIDVIKGLRSETQWTPAQQNPERSGWYIVTKRFGNGETWIGTKWYSTAYGWTGDGVLAWMELPEAYKEGE